MGNEPTKMRSRDTIVILKLIGPTFNPNISWSRCIISFPIETCHLGVSWNRGTRSYHPLLDGIFHEINHLFGGTSFVENPIYWWSIPFSDTKIRWFLDIKELILALWARHGHGAARRTDCAEMRRWRAGCFVLVQRKRRELAPVGWWWYQRQRIEQSKKKIAISSKFRSISILGMLY